MPRLVEQMPVERMVVLPFALLRELVAHEQELLAGMAEHEAVIGAHVGEALPVVSRHAAEDRALAVHDLVVGQRQDEIFGEGVEQAERDLLVMMLPVDRVLGDVVQGVVHPPHVPLVAEAKPADVDRPRHHRPGGGFFRRRGRVRKAAEHFRIEATKERDRVQILAAAELVRDPAAFRPAVVEIEHRRHRIDAQAVDPIAIEPEQRAREQEIGDLGAPVIVDQRAPVEVASLVGIGVLVERRAVEVRQSMPIVGEVTRHPVENDAEAGAMTGVDQRREIGRAAEPAGRREHSRRLIAPGAVEGMLGDRQEFHVREVEIADIGR